MVRPGAVRRFESGADASWRRSDAAFHRSDGNSSITARTVADVGPAGWNASHLAARLLAGGATAPGRQAGQAAVRSPCT